MNRKLNGGNNEKTRTMIYMSDKYFMANECEAMTENFITNVLNPINLSKKDYLEKWKDEKYFYKMYSINENWKINNKKKEYDFEEEKQNSEYEEGECESDTVEPQKVDAKDYAIDGKELRQNTHLYKEILQRKQNCKMCWHPQLHFNEPNMRKDSPSCTCLDKYKSYGIHHGIYPGENLVECTGGSCIELHHYKLIILPDTNFNFTLPTSIYIDENGPFRFEGFSILLHNELNDMFPLYINIFSINYKILLIRHRPFRFSTIKTIDTISRYIFNDLLDLFDFNLVSPLEKSESHTCKGFHFTPRFIRHNKNVIEMLSPEDVLNYLLSSYKPVMSNYDSENFALFSDIMCGSLVAKPGHLPSSVRIDSIELNENMQNEPILLVHIKTEKTMSAIYNDKKFREATKKLNKINHLNSFKTISDSDNELMQTYQQIISDFNSNKTRKCHIKLNPLAVMNTGLRCDISQHALLLPAILDHLRLIKCLSHLEKYINYKFKSLKLLKLALTHTSYRNMYFSVNCDHIKTIQSNCCSRFIHYGKQHLNSKRKKGIYPLLKIMSIRSKENNTMIYDENNERLEYLGDAVLDYVIIDKLFYMFPHYDEGTIVAFKKSIVRNRQLAILARYYQIHKFMLILHNSDYEKTESIDCAIANIFEALVGAIYLDSGQFSVISDFVSNSLFHENLSLRKTWNLSFKHELQIDYANGDRHLIETSSILKKLTKLEKMCCIQFKHIRLLAKALTMPSVKTNFLTKGNNQRLEMLGDTIFKLLVSDHLYKNFSHHQEGHLSLLRNTLVNKFVQARIFDEIGLVEYIIDEHTRELKTKTKADLLEAFIASLYVDKGLDACYAFCKATLFVRIDGFIDLGIWNDPKSKLQQKCVNLRNINQSTPDLPKYEVVAKEMINGKPEYTVSVFFKNYLLATSKGLTIQMAEMKCAQIVLSEKLGNPPGNRYWKFFPNDESKEIDLLESFYDQNTKTSILVINQISLENEGTYECGAYNKISRNSIKQKLSVNVRPNWIGKLIEKSIKVQKKDLDNFYLSCSVLSKPAANIDWFFQSFNKSFNEENQLKPTYSVDVQKRNNFSKNQHFEYQMDEFSKFLDNGVQNTTSIIKFVQSENKTHKMSGKYTCIAKNPEIDDYKIIQSTNVVVYYKPILSTPKNIHAININKPTILRCFIESNPYSEVEWEFYNTDDQLVKDFIGHDKIKTNMTKLKQESIGHYYMSQLILNNAQTENIGNYMCKSKNSQGKTMLKFTVLAQGKPFVPKNIKIVNINPNRVMISWNLMFDGGLTSKFKLFLKEINTRRSVIVTSLKDHIYLNKLNANTEYQLIISAINQYGESEKSKIQKFKTLDYELVIPNLMYNRKQGRINHKEIGMDKCLQISMDALNVNDLCIRGEKNQNFTYIDPIFLRFSKLYVRMCYYENKNSCSKEISIVDSAQSVQDNIKISSNIIISVGCICCIIVIILITILIYLCIRKHKSIDKQDYHCCR
ncbi:hypothetical protein A3Q56_01287 [Intoshia linei]|uniref:Uncharacterized protein n=1 Tax=Intoshia linei TaxID=1819745 RepID=A0A177BBB8_9BILA|nr:hypothetical protein A3Q56_01287 [Intoshia linei]